MARKTQDGGNGVNKEKETHFKAEFGANDLTVDYNSDLFFFF